MKNYHVGPLPRADQLPKIWVGTALVNYLEYGWVKVGVYATEAKPDIESAFRKDILSEGMTLEWSNFVEVKEFSRGENHSERRI